MSNEIPTEAEERTYPLGAAARLTGLTPDLLRAWERRYEIVVPLRTPGGTRRYRASDLDRLRLVKAAVDSGYRIGEVAQLDAEEIARRIADSTPPPGSPIESVISALDRLDGPEVERLIGLQLAALGPVHFAKAFAVPLLDEIGQAWIAKRLCVASEHLASSVLRSLLGSSLRAQQGALLEAPIVFSTLPGERHELGLLIAALTAAGAGGHVVYVGPDMPIAELVTAVAKTRARVLALSSVSQPAEQVSSLVAELREALPADVELWLGGGGSSDLELPAGVTRIESLDSLEQRVALLGVRPSVTR